MNLRSITLVLAAALTISGCAAPVTLPEAESSAVADEYPLTIEVAASETAPSQEITLESRPERIAALTYETAELVAHLGAIDRLVLVQESLAKPVLSSFPHEMAQVAHHARTEGTIDPEQVLAAEPDLVLVTPRRGLEQELSDVLLASGVPVLILPNQWATSGDVVANIELVGKAIGTRAEALDLIDTLTEGLRETAPEGAGTGPRVLMLSNQAGQPFVVAGSAFPLEVLRVAGGVDAGGDLGFVRSGPISAEEVIAAEPDAILLVDMNGSGDAVFAPLLENEAVAALDAVRNDHVLLVEGRSVQALGFTAAIEGRDLIADWLAKEVSAAP